MTNPFWIAPYVVPVSIAALIAGETVLRAVRWWRDPARRLARQRGCGTPVPCGPSCECAADAMDLRP